jgi:methylmalonyl-CoA/ethylmalonyl-CoA epimerase
MLPGFTFHHVGVATNSIAHTSKYYKEAGYLVSETVFDPVQNVNICFLRKSDHPCVELIEPVSGLSPVANIIKKAGVSPYHFCYEVQEITNAIAKLKLLNFIPLSKPINAVALNSSICFLYNKDLGLIEIVESK